jgi:hypothetical protein
MGAPLSPLPSKPASHGRIRQRESRAETIACLSLSSLAGDQGACARERFNAAARRGGGGGERRSGGGDRELPLGVPFDAGGAAGAAPYPPRLDRDALCFATPRPNFRDSVRELEKDPRPRGRFGRLFTATRGSREGAGSPLCRATSRARPAGSR